MKTPCALATLPLLLIATTLVAEQPASSRPKYNVNPAWLVKEGQAEAWRVRQNWMVGEKWWREYERTVRGRKGMIAKLAVPAPATAEATAQAKK